MSRDLNQLVYDLKRIERNIKLSSKEALGVIGDVITEDIRANFDRQGVETDSGFVAWKPSKAAMKERRKTLIKTGKLRDSIHFEIQPDSVLVGLDSTELKYGKFHNEGYQPNIKRKFMFVRKALWKKIDTRIDELNKTLK